MSTPFPLQLCKENISEQKLWPHPFCSDSHPPWLGIWTEALWTSIPFWKEAFGWRKYLCGLLRRYRETYVPYFVIQKLKIRQLYMLYLFMQWLMTVIAICETGAAMHLMRMGRWHEQHPSSSLAAPTDIYPNPGPTDNSVLVTPLPPPNPLVFQKNELVPTSSWLEMGRMGSMER